MAKQAKTTKKTAPKADKATAQTLDQMVELFLQKNEKKKLLEKDLERLKEGIEKEIEYRELAFDEDGEIAVSSGRVKQVASAPSLVWAKNERSLTPQEREKFAAHFESAFQKLDLNAKLLAEAFTTNHKVARQMNEYGVAVKQGTSLQVKSL